MSSRPGDSVSLDYSMLKELMLCLISDKRGFPSLCNEQRNFKTAGLARLLFFLYHRKGERD